MRNFSKTLIVIGLLALQVGPVFAQGTILPAPSKDADCNKILNDYEISGTIPSAANIQNVKNYKNAEKTFDEAKANSDKTADAYLTALDTYNTKQQEMQQCIDQYGAGGTNCSEKEYAVVDAQKAKQDAEKAKQEANTALDQAGKTFDAMGKNISPEDAKKDPKDLEDLRANLLGCGIKTGRISFSMIPYFITYIVNFALGLVGLISVLFIVLGGYFYVFGGLTEDKDKGKKTIVHALEGMGLALMAWTIVNVIMSAVTG